MITINAFLITYSEKFSISFIKMWVYAMYSLLNDLVSCGKIQDKITRKMGRSISVMTWLDKYLEIQKERIAQKEISEYTVKQRIAPVNTMRQALGTKPIADVVTRDIVDIIDEYKARGTTRLKLLNQS